MNVPVTPYEKADFETLAANVLAIQRMANLSEVIFCLPARRGRPEMRIHLSAPETR